MRLKITLRPKEHNAFLPINYQYPLSAAIYHILAQAEPTYADFLHREGYPNSHQKKLKLFVFSKLFFDRPAKVFHNTLQLTNAPLCWFFISSPMEETFVQNFVIGLFEKSEIAIGNKQNVLRFTTQQVESLPTPDITNELHGRTLSPISISVSHPVTRTPQYLLPLDENTSRVICNNLRLKYETIFCHGHGYPEKNYEGEIDWIADKNYITERGGETKTTKLITIKEDTQEETKVKGFNCPFMLRGEPEILRVAYECGLGERNSIGFGMISTREQ